MVKFESLGDTDHIDLQIGQIGFQSGLFEKFTKVSKAGKELVDQLVMHEVEKKEVKEALITHYIEILKKEAMILLNILKGEEDGPGNRKRDEEYQAAAIISEQLAKSAVRSSTPNQPTEKDSLASELSDVSAEIATKEKQYKKYEHHVDQAEKFIAKLPANKEESTEALKGEIARLEGTPEERQKQADEVYRLVDEGKETEARAMLDASNAKNAQIGALKHMLSVVEGTSKMYKQDGSIATSFKEAEFIVPEKQKLVKEGDTFYLLKKDETLTDANREQAARDFQRNKNEFMSVRSLIDSNKSIEMMALGSKIEGIKQRIEALPQVQSKHGMGSLSDTHDHMAHVHGSNVLQSRSKSSGVSEPTAPERGEELDAGKTLG